MEIYWQTKVYVIQARTVLTGWMWDMYRASPTCLLLPVNWTQSDDSTMSCWRSRRHKQVTGCTNFCKLQTSVRRTEPKVQTFFGLTRRQERKAVIQSPNRSGGGGGLMIGWWDQSLVYWPFQKFWICQRWRKWKLCRAQLAPINKNDLKCDLAISKNTKKS
jgi:hypothetical protein